MSIIKPIYVMNEEGLSELEKKAVLEGAEEMIKIAEAEDITRIIDLGVFNGEKNEEDPLMTYHSIDWYLQKGKEKSLENLLEANRLLNLLEASIKPFGQYHFLLLKSGIYTGTTPCVGIGSLGGPGAIVSAYKFKDLDEETRCGCIKTAAMHEIGHNFGLVNEKRENTDYTHCNNRCVMRIGRPSPEALITMTEDRLKYGPFCEPCEKYLKERFKEKPPVDNPKSEQKILILNLLNSKKKE